MTRMPAQFKTGAGGNLRQYPLWIGCAHIAAVMTLHTLGLNGEEAMIRVAYRASDRDCRAWETAH